jgi:hypothetical protein
MALINPIHMMELASKHALFSYDSREFTRIIEKTRESGEFLVNRPIMLFPA